MRRKLLWCAVAALALSLAALAASVCPYCKNSPASGEVIPLLQCKECYHQFCANCEFNKDGVYVCPWCKRGEGYVVGELGLKD